MKMAENTKPQSSIDKFGTNYNELVKGGKFDRIIGREEEISRIQQILSRRKKNSVIITGDAGVGKSAILIGLAQKIVAEECNAILSDKIIMELDLTAMVAGTKFRGQFEERLKQLMEEVDTAGNIILFIDEIHQLMGSGGSGGAMDGANIMKPALANGKLQLIGATTLAEYSKTISKDAALERRFQKVIINPPTKEETIEILKNIKSNYENHHSVIYDSETLENIVTLADRYITDRNFPDKAIDVLDEVGASVSAIQSSIPQHIKDLKTQLQDTKTAKSIEVKKQNYEAAAKLRNAEAGTKAQLESELNSWKNNKTRKPTPITLDDISRVVSSISGIPVSKVGVEENKRLIDLENVLNNKVIGQQEAVKQAAKAVQKSRIGLKKSQRPLSMLFLGSSGNGKTLLAKELAKFLFDDQKSLIRVNMNEFGEKISVSRLIGGAPGFVGYEEGGELTNKVRNKPYSVILLDEIEKAHPDVMDVFLQVLDEGSLTDAQGTVIDFQNTIIIMTSNIGTKKLNEFGTGIGFNNSGSIKDKIDVEKLLKKELEKTLKAEVLNRIGNIIVFNELGEGNLTRIVDLIIQDLAKRLSAMNYRLSVAPELNDLVVKEGFDVKYGARVIERTFTTFVEDPITELILHGIKEDSTINISVVDGAVKFTITENKSKRK